MAAQVWLPSVEEALPWVSVDLPAALAVQGDPVNAGQGSGGPWIDGLWIGGLWSGGLWSADHVTSSSTAKAFSTVTASSSTWNASWTATVLIAIVF